MMNDSYIRLLIIKYLTGSLTDEEAVRLARWVSESDENEIAYKTEVEAMSRQVNSSSDAAEFWAEFRARNAKEFEGIKKRRIRRRWVFSAIAGLAAAVAAIVFISDGSVEDIPEKEVVAVDRVQHDDFADSAQVSASCKESEGKTYVAEGGRIYRTVLPDGTKVVLNSDSSLRLSKSFNRSAREVFLDGEAFFDVAKDSSRLFIIRCGKESYIVRGTAFNITSYSTDGYSVATLHEGVLEARIRQDIIKLEPGEELRVDERMSSISKHKVNVENSTNWINTDKIVFEDTPLRQVANRLARKYRVDINIQSEIGNILYTGVNDDETIEDVLRLLEITAPVPLAVTYYEGEYFISKK